eukprot:TRINITY_DN15447_c0_g1_i1.p1 TRINITY_DN15447_c0_g1~~TRINITY_DN15447_c0_g1_i1.p1  ORF type:complete len:652 (+),score=143.48 TRINITY_DN15447_c0_g1_i1:232-2187(+)
MDGSNARDKSPSISPCTSNSDDSSDARAKKRRKRAANVADDKKRDKRKKTDKEMTKPKASGSKSAAKSAASKAVSAKTAAKAANAKVFAAKVVKVPKLIRDSGKTSDSSDDDTAKRPKQIKSGNGASVGPPESGVVSGGETVHAVKNGKQAQPEEASAVAAVEAKKDETATVLRMRAALQALRERRAELEIVRGDLEKSQTEVKALRCKMEMMHGSDGELQELRSAKASLSAETETLRSQLEAAARTREAMVIDAEALRTRLAAMKSENEEIQKTKAALSADARVLQSKLTSARSDLDDALRIKLSLAAEMETLRHQAADAASAIDLKAQTETLQREVVHLRSQIEEARTVGSLHVPELRVALEARLSQAWREAWSELGHIQDLPHRTKEPQKSSVRRRSSTNGGNPRRGKVVFASRQSDGVAVANHGSDAGVDVSATSAVPGMSESSKDQQPLVSQVLVTSYRDMKETLWFTTPENNVCCEICQKCVTQKQGRLRGHIGRSQFMLDQFVCGDCAAMSSLPPAGDGAGRMHCQSELGQGRSTFVQDDVGCVAETDTSAVSEDDDGETDAVQSSSPSPPFNLVEAGGGGRVEKRQRETRTRTQTRSRSASSSRSRGRRRQSRRSSRGGSGGGNVIVDRRPKDKRKNDRDKKR